MLRVTDRMGSLMTTQTLAEAQHRLTVSQQQASSGLRIHKASDDATAASRLARVDADEGARKQYLQNISRSMGAMDEADSALSHMNDLLLEIKEIAVAMGNGHYNAQDRAYASEQIAGIRAQIISLGNARFGDSYVFAGMSDDQPAFDSSGAYQGSTTRKRIEVGENYELDAGVMGSEVFNLSGGIDVMQSLGSLITGLANNDTTALAQGIVELVDISAQVANARSQVGRQVNRLEYQDTVHSDRELQLTADRARLAEADTIGVFSNMAQAQMALNASMRVSAEMLRTMNLLSYL
jgi:flagellar hook-associated protein 3 FlgL